MSNNDRFIPYLYSLKHESTGILAALRRACGQRLVESRNCQWFASISRRPQDFLTATLAAQYSSEKIRNDKRWPFKRMGNVGVAWAEYCRRLKKKDDPAAFYPRRQNDLESGRAPDNIPSSHERFRTLLDAELERDGTGELAYRLRGLVRLLVAEDIPIDIIQLAYDLRGWRAETRCVQKHWAEAFYVAPRGAADRTKKSDDAQSINDEQEESIEQESETHVD
jgi:CRISPR type I-E-associated protein CasB/Cse2